MRNGKYGHELELILLLTDNHNYTAQDIAEKLGITRRHLYNYLEYLRFSGFEVRKSGLFYRLGRSSAFFRRLHENISLSEDEAMHILRLINSGADTGDFRTHSIRQKLIRQYNLLDVRTPDSLSALNRNTSLLREAMNRKRMCLFHDYSSPHSQTVSDRIVEPFMLLNGGLDVRCHELKSHTNKTFKLARIGSIEILDVEWIAEKEHKQVFTDMFMFSGEVRHPVKLLLGQLSHNLLLEEYPNAELHMEPADTPSHWVFTADVASYLGIGRFVLGLFRDITVLGDADFKAYIAREVDFMHGKAPL